MKRTKQELAENCRDINRRFPPIYSGTSAKYAKISNFCQKRQAKFRCGVIFILFKYWRYVDINDITMISIQAVTMHLI